MSTQTYSIVVTAWSQAGIQIALRTALHNSRESITVILNYTQCKKMAPQGLALCLLVVLMLLHFLT